MTSPACLTWHKQPPRRHLAACQGVHEEEVARREARYNENHSTSCRPQGDGEAGAVTVDSIGGLEQRAHRAAVGAAAAAGGGGTAGYHGLHQVTREPLLPPLVVLAACVARPVR